MKNRRCTDLLFTILFLAFAGVCGYVCMEGFSNGDPTKLLSPVDYDGKLCGVDHPNHPYLYFLVNLDKIAPDASINYKAICVSECPALNTTEPLDCALITEITAANCAARLDFETGTPATGYIGYGTKSLFQKFCVPNL
jgi:hypothetical protein